MQQAGIHTGGSPCCTVPCCSALGQGTDGTHVCAHGNSSIPMVTQQTGRPMAALPARLTAHSADTSDSAMRPRCRTPKLRVSLAACPRPPNRQFTVYRQATSDSSAVVPAGRRKMFAGCWLPRLGRALPGLAARYGRVELTQDANQSIVNWFVSSQARHGEALRLVRRMPRASLSRSCYLGQPNPRKYGRLAGGTAGAAPRIPLLPVS